MVNEGSVKNWPEDDRPREKMMSRGKGSLTDAELLAILINTSGMKGLSALHLAKKILNKANNNIHDLGRLSLEELQTVEGIGPAKAITIAAALELGLRRQINSALEKPVILSSNQAAAFLVPLMRDLPHEVFIVVYLNHAGRLIRYEVISQGGITGTVADIRIILKNALLNNSNQIIVAHNHPSGNLQSSEADRKLTKKLKDAAALMDIKLVDHIIVGETAYVSMSDSGDL